MTTLVHSHTVCCGIPMRLAADDCGIRALLLGDAETTLGDLQARFPDATLAAGDSPAIHDALAHLENPAQNPPPPLAPAGTAFQKSVWSALCRIPTGRTTHYAALAATIGRPRAARAVAAACAANPVAILIPCHRVIRRDGSPAGYRWGLETKLGLLTAER